MNMSHSQVAEFCFRDRDRVRHVTVRGLILQMRTQLPPDWLWVLRILLKICFHFSHYMTDTVEVVFRVVGDLRESIVVMGGAAVWSVHWNLGESRTKSFSESEVAKFKFIIYSIGRSLDVIKHCKNKLVDD